MENITNNTDMTFARIYKSAANYFIARGWSVRSALMWAAVYAANKTAKQGGK